MPTSPTPPRCPRRCATTSGRSPAGVAGRLSPPRERRRWRPRELRKRRAVAERRDLGYYSHPVSAAPFHGGGHAVSIEDRQSFQQGGLGMSRKLGSFVALCAVPLMLAGCGGGAKDETATTETTPAAAPAAPAADAGAISGTVTFAGTDTDTPIAFSADPVCASLHKTPADTNEIAAKDGKLGN